MNRNLAQKVWRWVPVIWHADAEPQPQLIAAAETAAVPVTVVHYHLHFPPGTSPADFIAALPPRNADQTEKEN